MPLLQPPRWSAADLEADLRKAKDIFREERLDEPTDLYHEVFDEAQSTFETLLELTVDLSTIEEEIALEILSNPALQKGFRYIAGPPISEDDLMALAEAGSLSPRALRQDPLLVYRLVQTVFDGIDRGRFPWVNDKREPTEGERQAAITASAALVAMRRVETFRRHEQTKRQEGQVKQALLERGFEQVRIPHARVDHLSEAPHRGAFAGPITLGGASADILVGLWDGRTMAIECKTSNSVLNSRKRLFLEATSKAKKWRDNFGARQVVTVAVLSGLYSLQQLESAQGDELAIFWSHRLEDLMDWIERAR